MRLIQAAISAVIGGEGVLFKIRFTVLPFLSRVIEALLTSITVWKRLIPVSESLVPLASPMRDDSETGPLPGAFFLSES